MAIDGVEKASIDKWIGKADEVLYRANDLGSNRTEFVDYIVIKSNL